MITIQAQLSKKTGIQNIPYSSQHFSLSVTTECSDLSQVAAEAKRLYAIAEQAVDAQLLPRMAAPPVAAPKTSVAPAPQPVQRPAASQPYRNTNQRGPAPVTDSQLRFLTRLIQQSGSSLPAILERHEIGSLRDLSCKNAGGLISELCAAEGARS